MNKTKTKTQKNWDGAKGAVLLLLVVLSLMFWRSFLPDYVHFSNDGPLGAQATASVALPGAFLGSWGDNNDIGSSGGAWPLNLSVMFRWIFGPFGYAKFYAPFALFILGLGAWTFLRSLKLTWLATILGTLAVVLNTCYFAGACWGVASAQIAVGFDFLALGLFMGNDGEKSRIMRWVRLVLAGLCVGVNVMEAADIGVLCSVLVAGFVFFHELVKDYVPSSKTERTVVVGCTNVAICLLAVLVLWLGHHLGIAISDLFLVLSALVFFTIALNWSLVRELASAAKVERIMVLGSVDIALLCMFVLGALHGVSHTLLFLSLALAVALNLFLLFDPLNMNRCGQGIVRLAVIAGFAGFISCTTVVSLIGTPGLAGNSDDNKESEGAHWDWATQWSLPKLETIGIFVPGVFGYRMDTPMHMERGLQEKYNGGVYWGGIGRSPEIDRAFDAGAENPPGGLMRFGYAGYYAGVLTVLVALWALVQSFRRQNPVFSRTQKILVWFWGFVMVASLWVAWGRFADPSLYRLLYMLPKFSAIRNPAKFEIFTAWALAVLFAYGMDALSRRYLDATAKTGTRKWDGFDRNLILGFAGLLAVSVGGWYYYSAHKEALVQYLKKVGYNNDEYALLIANFSIGQAGWFVFLLAGAVILLALTAKGFFSGPRAKAGSVLLLAFLLFDMGRANLPYVIHWDYKQKYEVGTLNPIEKFLADKPYEHRVAKLLPPPLSTPGEFQKFDQLYGIEWTQHHFLYYNIQSLDVIQQPRLAGDLAAYQEALRLGFKQRPDGSWGFDDSTFYKLPRKWELSNTRYLLGPAAFVDSFNTQFDPGRNRFHIIQRFTVGPKPGVTEYHQFSDEETAYPNDNGEYALIEFTGALPRVKLYSNWQVTTNDPAILKTLADPNFDPAKTVMVSTPATGVPAISTNENSGTVDFKEYSSKHIVFSANAVTPSVMLLNDHYDPHWSVTVDGKPAELLRCNYVMRGVYLQPGPHTVEFNFSLSNPLLLVTMSAMVIGLLLAGWLVAATRAKARTAS